jgi:hypothetical protein
LTRNGLPRERKSDLEMDSEDSVFNRSVDGVANNADDSIRSSLDGVFLPDAGLLPESKKFWAESGTHPAGQANKPLDSTEISYDSSQQTSPRIKARSKPIYGSIVLPVYVYDCPLSSMIGTLACRQVF